MWCFIYLEQNVHQSSIFFPEYKMRQNKINELIFKPVSNMVVKLLFEVS